MTSEVLARLTPPPFEVTVDCGGEEHPITVLDGVPRARAHGDEERVLEIFGGTPPPCMARAWAVRQAPEQLTAFEEHAFRLRYRPDMPWGSVAASLHALRRHYAEPAVDAQDVPWLLRRLAVLGKTRADHTLKARRQHRFVDGVLLNWMHTVTGLGGSLGLTFTVAPHPGVVPGRTPGWSDVHLARDWLATVLLFGLETHGDALTLGARLPSNGDDEIRLVQLARDPERRPLAITRTASVSQTLPGIRFLSEARAHG